MKLLTYFLVIALLVVALGSYNYITQSKIAATNENIDIEFDNFVKYPIFERKQVFLIKLELENVRLYLHEMLLGETDAIPELQASISKVDKSLNDFKVFIKEENAEDMESDLSTLAVVDKRWAHIRDVSPKYISLVTAGNISAAGTFLHEEVESDLDEINIKFDKFIEDVGREIEETNTKVDKQIEIATTDIKYISIVTIILSFIVVILSIGLGLFISNRITRPLEKLSKVVDDVSKGNLDVKVEKTSSIKEINMLAESVERMQVSSKIMMEEYKKKKK